MNTKNPHGKGAARIAIEKFLAAQTGPVIFSVIRDGTAFDAKRIANALTCMRLAGQLETSGTAPHQGYRLITPPPKAAKKQQPKQPAWSPFSTPLPERAPAHRREAEIIYPPGYRHTVGSAPNHGTYTGADWTSRTLRPGCLDGERIGSRRGDDLVQHRTPLGMQTGNQRGTAYHRVPANQKGDHT